MPTSNLQIFCICRCKTCLILHTLFSFVSVFYQELQSGSREQDKKDYPASLWCNERREQIQAENWKPRGKLDQYVLRVGGFFLDTFSGCGDCRWQPQSMEMETQGSKQWLLDTVAVLLDTVAVLCLCTVSVLGHGCGQRQGTKWRKPGDIRMNYCYTSAAGPVCYSVFLDLLAKIICKIDLVSTISLTKRLHSLSMNCMYFLIFHFY